MKHAVCLVVDRLSAGFLGAYGNTWIHTPHFDQFASQSLLFDQALIDSPRLPLLYESWWRGSHALTPRLAPPLPDHMKSLGTATCLLTDDTEVAGLAGADQFDARSLVDLRDQQQPAEEVEATHCGQFFAAAIAQLHTLDQPTLLWLHTRALATSWDAPLRFREAYADQDDPPPPDTATVPCLSLAEDYDPDVLLGYTQAYAGQVTLWDECLGAFFHALDERGLSDQTLVMIVAARGFPLGEHRQVGPVRRKGEGEPLYGELIQVPLVVRAPGAGAAIRCPQLVQPADVYATLGDWFSGSTRSPGPPPAVNLLDGARPDASRRTRAVVMGQEGAWAVRTPAWFLRHAADQRLELYAKPDDRWEVNDVAARCPAVVRGLVDAYQATCRGDWTTPLELESDPVEA